MEKGYKGVYTYIYIHIHTYTYIYIHIHIHIHTYTARILMGIELWAWLCCRPPTEPLMWLNSQMIITFPILWVWWCRGVISQMIWFEWSVITYQFTIWYISISIHIHAYENIYAYIHTYTHTDPKECVVYLDNSKTTLNDRKRVTDILNETNVPFIEQKKSGKWGIQYSSKGICVYAMGI